MSDRDWPFPEGWAEDGDAPDGGTSDGAAEVVRARLRAEALRYEPDRDAIWARVVAGQEGQAAAPQAPRRRYVWQLAVAAAAAVVILGVNLSGRGPERNLADVVAGSGSLATNSSRAQIGVPAATAVSGAPSGTGPGNGPGSTSRSPAAKPSSSPSGGNGGGTPTPASSGAIQVSVQAARSGAGLTLPARSDGAWLVAAGRSGSQLVTDVQGGFGIGPVQVDGSATVREDSPFVLGWSGGSPVATGAGQTVWRVLAPAARSGDAVSLRVPLRPWGAPGTFVIYAATLGGGAAVRLDLLGQSASVELPACGAAVCPYVVTVRLAGTARVDGTLTLWPRGGGLGLAAVVQV